VYFKLLSVIYFSVSQTIGFSLKQIVYNNTKPKPPPEIPNTIFAYDEFNRTDLVLLSLVLG